MRRFQQGSDVPKSEIGLIQQVLDLRDLADDLLELIGHSPDHLDVWAIGDEVFEHDFEVGERIGSSGEAGR